VWDHYGEFDPQEASGDPGPGSVVRVLDQGLSLAKDPVVSGAVLDTGCAVGRCTFELAQRYGELTLGVDLNFSMLQVAQKVLGEQTVAYGRRKVGMVYEPRRFAVRFGGSDRVDFWACDASALPFAAGTFATAVSLNLLDCVASPLDLLKSLRGVLKDGGRLVMSTPYDWSGNTTDIEAWIGGHSPRSPGGGASEPVLRALLTPGGHAVSVDGLELVGEAEDVGWQVRLHDRHVAAYKVHLVAAIAGTQAK